MAKKSTSHRLTRRKPRNCRRQSKTSGSSSQARTLTAATESKLQGIGQISWKSLQSQIAQIRREPALSRDTSIILCLSTRGSLTSVLMLCLRVSAEGEKHTAMKKGIFAPAAMSLTSATFQTALFTSRTMQCRREIKTTVNLKLEINNHIQNSKHTSTNFTHT